MKFCCFLLFFLTIPIQASGQQQDVTHGTLITILGNRNGIVVVSDSMATDRFGRQSRIPVQKLIQYDERTVIATAGFLANITPGTPELTAQLLGVIAEYRDRVRESGKQQSMAETVLGVSGALALYLETFANVSAVTGTSESTVGQTFNLELRMAGYDVDWRRLIVSADMLVTPTQLSDGSIRWSTQLRPVVVKEVKDALEIVPAGISTVEDEMMLHPEQHADIPIMREFITSMKADGGASLSLAQMKKLGQLFKDRTANVDTRVGNRDQIAVVAVGRVLEFDTPNFPEISNPIPLTPWLCDPGATLSGPGDIIGGFVVFENCTFANKLLTLDEKAFVHCTFRDSQLFYNGGSLILGEDNKIEGESRLQMTRRAYSLRPGTAKMLEGKFDFLHGGRLPPTTPPNPKPQDH